MTKIIICPKCNDDYILQGTHIPTGFTEYRCINYKCRFASTKKEDFIKELLKK
jgi:hypothetical protein